MNNVPRRPRNCKKGAYQANLTGFLLALFLFSLSVVWFSTFASSISTAYNIDDNSSFSSYDKQAELISQLKTIEQSTKIEQQEGILDVIGGFFSSGYSALRTGFLSFSIFDDMVNQAQQDLVAISPIFPFFRSMIIVLLVVGLAMSALLKVST